MLVLGLLYAAVQNKLIGAERTRTPLVIGTDTVVSACFATTKLLAVY